MHRITEAETRKEMIDPQLEKAGWYLRDHTKVRIEIPVDGYDAEPWNGVTDYCLYRENGEVLAVVEAKKTAVDVRLAEAQLEYYVTEIEKHQSFRPFGFLANGREIYFVDVGLALEAAGGRLLHAATTWKTCCSSARRASRSARWRSTTASLTAPTSTRPSAGWARPSKGASARR